MKNKYFIKFHSNTIAFYAVTIPLLRVYTLTGTLSRSLNGIQSLVYKQRQFQWNNSVGLSPGCDLWKHLRPTVREIKWTILRAVDSLPVGNVSIASTFFNFQLVARNTRVADCIKIRIVPASMYIQIYSSAKLKYYTRKKFLESRK